MSQLDKSFIALQNKIIRMEKMGQKTIAKNYKKVLDDLRISMAKLYNNYEIDGQLTFSEMAKYSRLQKLDKEVYTIVTELYQSNSKVISGTLAGIVKETYSNSLSIVEDATQKKLKGILKPLDVNKTVNEQMAGLKWTERMGKHRADAIYDIQKEIRQGLVSGDTYATMSNRLKGKLETDINKANAIIRTESHRVHGQAKEDSFDRIEKSGVKFKEKWISGRDQRVRSAHQELDGVIIDRGDMFYSPTGAIGPGPGLMNSAEDDINCRCIKVMVLE